MLLVFGMWWLYFDTPVGEHMEDVREHFAESQYRSFVWGYGHYLVFATAAAARGVEAAAAGGITPTDGSTGYHLDVAAAVVAAVGGI